MQREGPSTTQDSLSPNLTPATKKQLQQPFTSPIWYRGRKAYQTIKKLISCKTLHWCSTHVLQIILYYQLLHWKSNGKHNEKLLLEILTPAFWQTWLSDTDHSSSELEVFSTAHCIVEYMLPTAILMNTKSCLESINGQHTACLQVLSSRPMILAEKHSLFCCERRFFRFTACSSHLLADYSKKSTSHLTRTLKCNKPLEYCTRLLRDPLLRSSP